MVTKIRITGLWTGGIAPFVAEVDWGDDSTMLKLPLSLENAVVLPGVAGPFGGVEMESSGVVSGYNLMGEWVDIPAGPYPAYSEAK